MTDRYYLPADMSREDKDKLRKYNVCPECGDWLSFWKDKDGEYLACHRHDRNQHEGIAREYNKQSQENIIGRQEMNNSAIVKRNQDLVAKGIPLTGVVDYENARKIIDTLWKDAPDIEKYKAAMLCQDFGLHPLMNHVYLIPYNKYEVQNGQKVKVGTSWSTVLGIGATREIAAARGGTFSYTDNTPRIMSEDEQMMIFGEIDKTNIVAITKLRTLNGLEAQGYGKWPKAKEPQGTDKGTTKANMAFIRSERNAFKRLFPKDVVPSNVEVVDEQYMPQAGEYIDADTGEIIDDTTDDVVIEEDSELSTEEDFIDSVATVVEEPEPQPAHEPAPAPAPARNERVVSASQYKKLVDAVKQLGWTSGDVGKFMNKEKNWGVKDLKTLKVWQYEEFMAIVKKTLEG
jgi:hypothetical protein